MNANQADSPRDCPTSAESWLARLHAPDCGPAERAAFEHWRAQHPDHAQAYAQAERLHANAALLAGDPLLRAASLAARRRTAARRDQRRLLARLLPMAVAASVLLAFGVPYLLRGTHVDHGGFSRRYASATELPRRLTLDDGTQMILDADSTVTTHFDAQRRLVTLERGRAEFAVAHAAAPFEVHAGGNVIRDTGTVFQVSKERDVVVVGLLAGSVEVTHGQQTQALSPAQQLRIAADGSSAVVGALDTQAAQAWGQGELVFRERRLDSLLAEMNRYSDTKLLLGDQRLADLRISGSFHAGDQQALVKALDAGWGLRAVTTGSHELTLYPGSPSNAGGARR
ncbi:FecR domain-containing protein [Dyella sp. SG609]|uniref:FecR family protein n=1 Tax=Dyella sp. SG609 TaxID=2587018 RepID=UPI0014467FEB|nr:FecR domain-containing protein [Dyella sp. SG609]NKJ22802.1 transmembrane sensor [Dyella sp. SG609]